MALTMPVRPELDESKARSVADNVIRLFDGVGHEIGSRLGSEISSGIGSQGGAIFSEISKAATSMGTDIATGAAVGVTGLTALAAAATAVSVEAFNISNSFAEMSQSMAESTGAVGDQLNDLMTSVQNVGRETSSSFEEISTVMGSLSANLQITGAPLEDLTKSVSELNEMTGNKLNVNEFGMAMRAFGQNADEAASDLEALNAAHQQTGAAIGDLLSQIDKAAPAAETLGLNFSQTAELMVDFSRAGIDAGRTSMALQHATEEFAKKHVDLNTGLQDTITQIKGFIDAGTNAAAVDLAGKVFGTRGADQFVQAIKTGKTSVDDLNGGIKTTNDSIDDTYRKTETLGEKWSETWHNMELAMKPVGDFLGKIVGGVLDIINNPGNVVPTTLPASDQPITPLSPKDLLTPSTVSPTPGAPAVPGPAGVPSLDQLLMPQTNTATIPHPPPGSPQDVAGAVDGSGKSQLPQVPYPADYGAPPQPGETPEDYRARMSRIETQHNLAQKRADLDAIEKDNTKTQDDIVKARNEVAQAEVRANEEEARAVKQKTPEVPYAPGFGAPPRPGENLQQYDAEQRLLDVQHTVAEDRAKLAQIEAEGTHTTEELTRAKNDLIKAEGEEYKAQLQLQDVYLKASEKLGEIGAKLDADFGASKGLPGLVDNAVKALADIAAAPMLGQLSATSAMSPIQGGYGLAGILGADNIAAGLSPMGFPLGGGPGTPSYDALRALGMSPKQMQNMGFMPGSAPSMPSPYDSGSSSGYAGDAALLANVPAGRYDGTGATADLTKGLGDCSSAVEDLVNLMDGKPTAGRSMATGNEADWLTQRGFLPTNQPMPGTFQVGFNDHHTQATLPGGTPFNWGSDAAAAKGGVDGTGAWDSAFTSHYYRPVNGSPGGNASGAAPLGASSVTINASSVVVNAGGTGASAPAGGGGGGAGGSGGDGRNWDALAAKEAGGNWANTSNPKYSGGLQFDDSTWAQYGGTQYAPKAAQASKDDQIAVAIAALNAGRSPQSLWPQNYSALGAPSDAGGSGGGWGGPQGLPPGLHGGAGQSPVFGPRGPMAGSAAGSTLGPGQGPTQIGGVEPPSGSGSGIGITPGGSLDTAVDLAASAFPGVGQAAATGVKLANRAIQYAGQVAGIGMSGLMETFLPTGGSELANKSWLAKGVGALAGAHPQLPNVAGKSTLQPGQGQGQQQQGQGGGDTNITVNNQRATEDGTGRDIAYHQQQAQIPAGMP